MAASSSEESLRDDRRGPDEEVVKAGDVPAGTVEGAACLHAAAGDAEPAEKKRLKTRTGRMAPSPRRTPSTSQAVLEKIGTARMGMMTRGLAQTAIA